MGLFARGKVSLALGLSDGHVTAKEIHLRFGEFSLPRP